MLLTMQQRVHDGEEGMTADDNFNNRSHQQMKKLQGNGTIEETTLRKALVAQWLTQAGGGGETPTDAPFTPRSARVTFPSIRHLLDGSDFLSSEVQWTAGDFDNAATMPTGGPSTDGGEQRPEEGRPASPPRLFEAPRRTSSIRDMLSTKRAFYLEKLKETKGDVLAAVGEEDFVDFARERTTGETAGGEGASADVASSNMSSFGTGMSGSFSVVDIKPIDMEELRKTTRASGLNGSFSVVADNVQPIDDAEELRRSKHASPTPNNDTGDKHRQAQGFRAFADITFNPFGDIDRSISMQQKESKDHQAKTKRTTTGRDEQQAEEKDETECSFYDDDFRPIAPTSVLPPASPVKEKRKKKVIKKRTPSPEKKPKKKVTDEDAEKRTKMQVLEEHMTTKLKKRPDAGLSTSQRSENKKKEQRYSGFSPVKLNRAPSAFGADDCASRHSQWSRRSQSHHSVSSTKRRFLEDLNNILGDSPSSPPPPSSPRKSFVEELKDIMDSKKQLSSLEELTPRRSTPRTRKKSSITAADFAESSHRRHQAKKHPEVRFKGATEKKQRCDSSIRRSPSPNRGGRRSSSRRSPSPNRGGSSSRRSPSPKRRTASPRHTSSMSSTRRDKSPSRSMRNRTRVPDVNDFPASLESTEASSFSEWKSFTAGAATEPTPVTKMRGSSPQRRKKKVTL